MDVTATWTNIHICINVRILWNLGRLHQVLGMHSSLRIPHSKMGSFVDCADLDTHTATWSTAVRQPSYRMLMNILVCQQNHLTQNSNREYISVKDIHTENINSGNAGLLLTTNIFTRVGIGLDLPHLHHSNGWSMHMCANIDLKSSIWPLFSRMSLQYVSGTLLQIVAPQYHIKSLINIHNDNYNSLTFKFCLELKTAQSVKVTVDNPVTLEDNTCIYDKQLTILC